MEKEIKKIIPAAQIKENLKVGIISLILGILCVLPIITQALPVDEKLQEGLPNSCQRIIELIKASI